MRLAEVNLQRKRPEQIGKTIQQLNDLQIQNAETLLYQAQSLGMLDEWKQAAELAQRAGLLTKDPDLHQQIADILNQAGQAEASMAAHARALRLKGMLAYRENQLAEAEALLDQSLSLNSADSQAWYDRGLIQLALGKTEAARSDFQACLNREPRHGRAQRQLTPAKNK